MRQVRARIRAVLAVASAIAGGGALAHHSFAMFDSENPIELIGTVKEFKYTNPHTFILLDVKEIGRAHV